MASYKRIELQFHSAKEYKSLKEDKISFLFQESGRRSGCDVKWVSIKEAQNVYEQLQTCLQQAKEIK